MRQQKKPSRCHKCIRKAEHKLVDKWYCSRCFCGLVEQKIRQNLRKHSLRRDSMLLVTDKASLYAVKKAINIPVQIVQKGKADHIVLPWTMDDENEEFLTMLIRNKDIVARPNKKVIKLFYPLSKQDMKTYFKIKKVAYRPVKTELNSLMDGLEERHPGTKRSLLKSEERLRAVLR